MITLRVPWPDGDKFKLVNKIYDKIYLNQAGFVNIQGV